MNTITVLLAEDQLIILEGLRELLALDAGIQIVAAAQDGLEATTLARKHRPEVVVMDIGMPRLNGFEAMQQILHHNPAIKVLMLTTHTDAIYIERATALGASGYLIKQSSTHLLAEAIHAVFTGKDFVDAALLKRLAHRRRADS